MTAHQWIALIPAYEPGSALPELVHQARRAGLEPVVVDDGSGNAWREMFADLRGVAAVLTHERNHGKGRAIKTGLAYIRKNFAGSYVVVTLDGETGRLQHMRQSRQRQREFHDQPHAGIQKQGETAENGAAIFHLGRCHPVDEHPATPSASGSSTMVFNGVVVNNPTSSGRSIKGRSASDIVYIGY